MGRFEAEHEIRVNGVTLHYALAGEGRPVVLVHGNGESHELFETEIEQLTEAGFQVYAPDSRGHGANEPLDEYHFADMAEDMYQFIRALCPEKPAYYGHSDGGIIGLLLELTHPGTLGALAFSGVNLSPAGLDPAFIAACEAEVGKERNPLVTLMLTEPHIDPERLREIAVPVLITAGEHDLILPEETARIAEHVPHGKLVIVPGADHGSYVSDSRIMGDLLIDFLKNEGSGRV